jgi:hypothetical protein
MLDMINTILIGTIEYTISEDEPNVIRERYISSGSILMGPGEVCNGRAEGDTTYGFPGDYVIRTADATGELGGEYDLRIEAMGNCYKLLWIARDEKRLPAAPGEILFEGFGFPSKDGKSIVGSYWITAEISRRVEHLIKGSHQTAP